MYRITFADFNKAIALNPNLAEAYANSGLLYAKMGNTKTARINLQQAQQLFISQGNSAGAEKVASILQQLP